MRSVYPSLYVNLRTSLLLASAILATGSVSCAPDGPGATEPIIGNTVAAHASVTDAHAIVVTNASELVGALVPANAGRKILVRSGTYNVTQPLFVPDSATLAGEGEMLLDDSGLPTGFAAGTRTTLAMTANVRGDVLTLGNGASVRDIAIEDLPGRTGSVIAVGSRDAGDSLSATITEVEIGNPNTHAIVLTGPAGCGVTVLTRNPNLGAPPGPHVGAAVSATMTRSLIHSPSAGPGCGVFAFNFAPLASLSVDLRDNVIGGGIIANGGVSLPEAVHDSKTVVQSRGNLYRDDSPNPCVSKHVGWNLAGGSGVPAPAVIGETSRNTLRVHSQGDRIEAFTTGILASGGRRFFGLPTAGPVTDNTIDLELIGTDLSTSSCGGASFVTDFRMAGALVTNASLTPGDGNTVHAVIRNVSGSGTRTNFFVDALGPAGPLAPQYQGTGNRLEIAGTLQAFERTNRDIDPAPGAELFTGGK
ncbi:MAG: hypothetical protein ABI681_13780 [Gemmatimonadales bacterium]